MEQRWKITVNRDACLGSGLCAGTAPEYFRLDEETSRPLKEVVEPDELLLDVAETCPAEAIAIHDSDGRQLSPDY
jgi:ferredoxin